MTYRVEDPRWAAHLQVALRLLCGGSALLKPGTVPGSYTVGGGATPPITYVPRTPDA